MSTSLWRHRKTDNEELKLKLLHRDIFVLGIFIWRNIVQRDTCATLLLHKTQCNVKLWSYEFWKCVVRVNYLRISYINISAICCCLRYRYGNAHGYVMTASSYVKPYQLLPLGRKCKKKTAINLGVYECRNHLACWPNYFSGEKEDELCSINVLSLQRVVQRFTPRQAAASSSKQ